MMYIYLGIITLMTGLDLGMKWIVRQFPEDCYLFDIGPLFFCYRMTNTGMAFSLLTNHTVLVTLLGFVLTIYLIWLFWDSKDPVERIALAVLMGGTLGNLIDRCMFGGVTDYLCFKYLPQVVFNFADICVIAGYGVYLLITLIQGED